MSACGPLCSWDGENDNSGSQQTEQFTDVWERNRQWGTKTHRNEPET